MWSLAEAIPPILHAIVQHNRVILRWFFNQPAFIQYYNITYRWDDQIGFAVTELPGSQLEWDMFGLMSGGTYVFRVLAATPWDSAYSEIERTTSKDFFVPIDYRSQTTYTAPCNGIVSHGAPIGGIQVLLTTHVEINTNKMCPRDHVGFQVCLSSCSGGCRCR